MRNDVTITVNANLEISDSTAERCMRLLEMWLDDNPDKTIVCNRTNNKHKMYIMKEGKEYGKHNEIQTDS